MSSERTTPRRAWRPSRLRSDEQLLHAFRAGDESAFEALYDRHQPGLVSLAASALRPVGGDPEAVVQESLLRAHRGLRTGSAPVAVKPWLRRVVRNACIDELRRAAARPAAAASDVEGHAGSAPDVFATLSIRDDLRRLLENLADLPEAQRAALLMRELDGLTHEQIAEQLDVSAGASKSLVTRARRNLVATARAEDEACATIRKDVDAAHDGRRRPTEHALRHLRRCEGCREYRDALKATTADLRSLTPALGFGPLGALAVSIAGGAAKGGGGGSAVKITAAVLAAVTVGGVAAESTGVIDILRGPVAAPRSEPGGRQNLGQPIRRGTRLPSGLAILTTSVRLPANASRTVPMTVRIPCPAGLRTAGLTNPRATPNSPAAGLAIYRYARPIRTGQKVATIVYGARPGLPAPVAVTLGTQCEKP